MERAATAARRESVQRAGRANGLHAVLVTHPPNVRYLTGFTGSSGWLLLGGHAALLLTDPRYREQAPAQAAGCDVAVCEAGLAEGLLASSALDAGACCGYEAAHLSCALLQALERDFPTVRWQAATGLVERPRQIKDGGEVAAIRRALEIAEASLLEVAPTVCAGQSEVEVAAGLEYACRLRGAEGMSFDTIVASGVRGSLPHARPGARRLLDGDLVVVDMGCVVNGYCSDITRALVVGDELPTQWTRVFEAVASAQLAAVELIRAGAACSAVDAAARTVLDRYGFGEHFTHGIGHGVGLEVHEAPRLSSRSEDALRAGQVVTVEPGVYMPGVGGLRLEDMVLVTATGFERLNALSCAPIFGRGRPSPNVTAE